MNQNTTHPERYEYANVGHHAIAQAVYMCKIDGNLVLDLEAHDRDHALQEPIQTASEPPAEVGEPESSVYRITEPAVDAVADQVAAKPVVKRSTPKASTT